MNLPRGREGARCGRVKNDISVALNFIWGMGTGAAPERGVKTWAARCRNSLIRGGPSADLWGDFAINSFFLPRRRPTQGRSVYRCSLLVSGPGHGGGEEGGLTRTFRRRSGVVSGDRSDLIGSCAVAVFIEKPAAATFFCLEQMALGFMSVQTRTARSKITRMQTSAGNSRDGIFVWERGSSGCGVLAHILTLRDGAAGRGGRYHSRPHFLARRAHGSV